MVDKNSIRASFSARLHQALDDAGVRSRGRGVDIHLRLKEMGVRKTTQAISKWLNGEAIAEADSMVALCNWLNIRREWLEYGVLPKSQNRHAGDQLVTDEAAMANEMVRPLGQVPLVTWSQAVIINTSMVGTHDIASWIYCPIPIDPKGYALKVCGDSMVNPGGGRSYPVGCLIFVDPTVNATTGDRVVAKVPGSDELTFKVFVADAGRYFLRPLNPQYPIIDISEDTQIYGKVIGTFIPE